MKKMKFKVMPPNRNLLVGIAKKIGTTPEDVVHILTRKGVEIKDEPNSVLIEEWIKIVNSVLKARDRIKKKSKPIKEEKPQPSFKKEEKTTSPLMHKIIQLSWAEIEFQDGTMIAQYKGQRIPVPFAQSRKSFEILKGYTHHEVVWAK